MEKTRPTSITVIKNNEKIPLDRFEELIGFSWIFTLDFIHFHDLFKIRKKLEKLQKKEKLETNQVWLGKYFEKEVLSAQSPRLQIRWIDEDLGWGVFADQNIPKHRFIAEYSGVVRKRMKDDQKNSYCFEYPFTNELRSNYVIDAREKGGVGRFINHSEEPNCTAALTIVNGINRIIITTHQPIAKGEQLCYHYGPYYWKKRGTPQNLLGNIEATT